MLLSRIFLAAAGTVYIALAAWCTIKPASTSQIVGFELKPGSGQSEFLVIYGGLELALGIVFLLPLLKPSFAESSLLTCLILHACLVLFRTVSFFLYSGISSQTRQLAFYEWLIFLAAAGLMWRQPRG